MIISSPQNPTRASHGRRPRGDREGGRASGTSWSSPDRSHINFLYDGSFQSITALPRHEGAHSDGFSKSYYDGLASRIQDRAAAPRRVLRALQRQHRLVRRDVQPVRALEAIRGPPGRRSKGWSPSSGGGALSRRRAEQAPRLPLRAARGAFTHLPNVTGTGRTSSDLALLTSSSTPGSRPSPEIPFGQGGKGYPTIVLRRLDGEPREGRRKDEKVSDRTRITPGRDEPRQ